MRSNPPYIGQIWLLGLAVGVAGCCMVPWDYLLELGCPNPRWRLLWNWDWSLGRSKFRLGMRPNWDNLGTPQKVVTYETSNDLSS